MKMTTGSTWKASTKPEVSAAARGPKTKSEPASANSSSRVTPSAMPANSACPGVVLMTMTAKMSWRAKPQMRVRQSTACRSRDRR